ncbi:3-hydroxyacyl-CoA dehydrogenase family protein [Ruminococcaceae bacterium OttesenSCG-928-D13]|nr:3-hydroxyacyl-CoA dehydrogenase family protein [Ruminococcaceae bacterium OttesenSCG-928-D13]
MGIENIQNVLIVGGGMMGKGIAHIMSGLPALKVTVYDIADQDFTSGLRATFDQLVQRGVLEAAEADARSARVGFITSLDDTAVSGADLVIECVFEDMALKQETFEKLEARCRADCIFCTNTSVMSPTEIGSKLIHKQRLVGTHFWNPAYLIPLVEVVKTDSTDDGVAETVLAFLKAAGKKAVLCNRDVPGFIANRMQHALWREAIYIVEQGIADAATVDEAVKNSFGLRLPQLGPLENADMIGLDLSYNIHDYILKYLCDSHAPSPLLADLKDKGALGFKSGHGFQSWSEEAMTESKSGLNDYLIDMLYAEK